LENTFDDNIECIIESYQNGREQGFALSIHSYLKDNNTNTDKLWIAFSAARGSDSLMVYYDKDSPMQGLSDWAYENGRKSFSPSNKKFFEQGADYIIELIGEKILGIFKTPKKFIGNRFIKKEHSVNNWFEDNVEYIIKGYVKSTYECHTGNKNIKGEEIIENRHSINVEDRNGDDRVVPSSWFENVF
jgi:hypothetical protein